MLILNQMIEEARKSAAIALEDARALEDVHEMEDARELRWEYGRRAQVIALLIARREIAYCPQCHGDGQVGLGEAREKCDVCGGTGGRHG